MAMEVVAVAAAQLVCSAVVTHLQGGKDVPETDSYTIPCGGQLPDKLIVHIERGENIYNPNWLPKMDPYICAYLSGCKSKKQMTSPIKSFGKNPKINEILRFKYLGQQKIVIQIYDYEKIMSDEFIAEAGVDLLPILNSPGRHWEGPIDVFGKGGGEKRGKLHVKFTFEKGDPFIPSNPTMLMSIAGNAASANAYRSAIMASYPTVPPGASAAASGVMGSVGGFTAAPTPAALAPFVSGALPDSKKDKKKDKSVGASVPLTASGPYGSQAYPAGSYAMPPGTMYAQPPGASYGAPPGASYGAPPGASYGAPPGAPPGASYGAPPGASYGAPPAAAYGAPPGASYGAPPGASYGVPPPGASYGAPQSAAYGAPPGASYPPPPPGSSYASPPGSPGYAPPAYSPYPPPPAASSESPAGQSAMQSAATKAKNLFQKKN